MIHGESSHPLLGEMIGSGASSLPLLQTEAHGQVLGLHARVALIQRFANPFTEPIELQYRFAIPHRAALVGFEIRIGERTITSEIAPRAEAEKEYRAAIEAGHRAALTTEERPNLYTVQIGHIAPGEELTASYRYLLPMDYEAGGFEIVLPFGVTPRYHHPEEPPEEAARTEVAIAPPGAPVSDLEITLSIDAGVPIGDPTSPSHRIAITRIDERRCLVRLVEPRVPNQDFILRYPTAATSGVASGAWVTRTAEGDLFHAIFIPPPSENLPDPEPREYVLVLDRSGSMAGEPIAQARNALRACLRLLGPADTFRIVAFDNELEWYKPSRERPQPFTDPALRAADSFLAGIEGRGGTNIIPALRAVAKGRRDPARRRVVVLFTDGAVSAEGEAARIVREDLARDRLFCFGIGPAVNRYLLDQLAEAGRGAATVVGLDEDIEGAIIRFQDRLSYPVLTDLALSVAGAPLDRIFPSPLPDLYAGQALTLVARAVGLEPGAAITLRGRRGAEEITLRAIAAPETDRGLVHHLWAQRELDELLRPGPNAWDTEAIIARSRASGILTPETALLAVERVASASASPRRIVVSSPLPAGLRYSASHSSPSFRMAPPAAFRLRPSPSSPSDVRELPALLPAPPPRRLARKAWPPSPDDASRSAPAADPAITRLRELIRRQRVDGSWDGSVEFTAAALVAFARAGATPRRGSFRRPLERACQWLQQHARQPLEELYECWAQAEIAASSGAASPANLPHLAALSRAIESSEIGAVLAARIATLAGAPSSRTGTNDPRVRAILAQSLGDPAPSGLHPAWGAYFGQVDSGFHIG